MNERGLVQQIVMEGFILKVRKKYSQVVSSGFDPQGYVLNKLFEEEIITIQQKIEVNECSDAKTRVEKLLTILFEASHLRTFIVFREALQKDHGWIVKLIDGTDFNGSKMQ